MRIRERRYIPAKDFLSYGAGTPAISQVTGRNLEGLDLDAAGEVGTFYLRLPYNFDPDHDIGIRVHYTTDSSTDGDTFDWVVLWQMVEVDAAIPTGISNALDTVISQDTLGASTAFLNKWTERGLIDSANVNLKTRAQVEGGVMLLVSIELDATDVNIPTENVWLLGAEVDFNRLDYVGTTDLEQGLTSTL